MFTNTREDTVVHMEILSDGTFKITKSYCKRVIKSMIGIGRDHGKAAEKQQKDC